MNSPGFNGFGLAIAAMIVVVVGTGVGWWMVLPEMAPKRIAIAVLPFAETGSSSSDAYLGPGLAAEIVSALASVPDFDVLDSRETHRYRSGETRLRQLADTLGATYAVEGSVRREGDRLSVSAHLTDLSDLDVTWRDSARGSVDDIFALRDAIADAIAEKLLLDDAEVSAGPAIDLRAYEMYLRARTHGDQGNHATAREYAVRSLAISDDNPYAHYYLGYLRFIQDQGDEMRHLEAALAADPTFAPASALAARLQTPPEQR